MSNHFYIPQQEHLNDVIHSIWQVDRFNTFQKEQILPKGIVEIIFNFSNHPPIPARLDDRRYDLSKCFINGFNTIPVQLQLPERQVFFGVQLQPLAVKKLVGAPAAAFSNTVVDLTLLNGAFNSLWHQLAEQPDFNKRVLLFCNWTEKKLFPWQPQEKLVNHFLCANDQHNLSVKELARSLCYSPRYLSRKIFDATGMNTEEMLLYKKYLHAVHLMHHTNLPLTKIAYQSHFSDQSHFIKSFRAYTQITPGEYKRSKGFMAGHLYENVR